MPGLKTAKSVTLTNGSTVTMGWISWKLWKEVKNRIIQLISTSLTPDVTAQIVQQWEAFAAAEPGKSIFQVLQPQILNLVPGLLTTINGELDELSEKIVRDCAVGHFPEDQLRAADWMALREAAAEVNDWGGMLDAEKNSVLAVFMSNAAGSTKSTLSSPDGGSAGKTSSSPEAGTGETSSAAPPETSSVTSST